MTTLVTGGSKCGKSSFAEKILEHFTGRKIYLATMQPFCQDAYEAIERHRKMRAGKNFETVEKYMDIHEVSLPEKCALMLECVGNLCANEMFREEKISDSVNRIVNGIKLLSERTEEFVIVTNQVGGDGISYLDGTSEYIRQLGEINSRIAEISDNVIECVYGIPVILKGEMPC